MGSWTLVFTASSQHEAALVRGLLEANDIHAVVMDQSSSPYPPLGASEVYVASEDVVRALYLVRKHRET